MFDDGDTLDVDTSAWAPEKSFNIEVCGSLFDPVNGCLPYNTNTAIHRPKGLGSILERRLRHQRKFTPVVSYYEVVILIYIYMRGPQEILIISPKSTIRKRASNPSTANPKLPIIPEYTPGANHAKYQSVRSHQRYSSVMLQSTD